MTVAPTTNYEHCNHVDRRNLLCSHEVITENVSAKRRVSCSSQIQECVGSKHSISLSFGNEDPIHCPLPSTEEIHGSGDMHFFGPYATARAKLDYSHHSNYQRDRQYLQDKIIERALNSSVRPPECNSESQPSTSQQWITFTAGAMGAGKSHAMEILGQKNRFPLDQFIRVDPDEIRKCLPEYSIYLDVAPEQSGELTNKECGYVAELMTMVALEHRRNVLVEGTLRNATWHRFYFDQIRLKAPSARIAIIYITAPKEAVIKRARERSLRTGRVVPLQALEDAFHVVPKSVKELTPLVDYSCELSNKLESGELELVTSGQTWNTFTSRWIR